MTCRNQTSREDIVKHLSQVTARDFEDAFEKPEHVTSNHVQHIFKSITTKCKSLGHTPEAAQGASKWQFEMMDHFGPNIIFLTITPENKCIFQVWLYTNPKRLKVDLKLPLQCYVYTWFSFFSFTFQISMTFQMIVIMKNVKLTGTSQKMIEIFIDSLMQCDSKKKISKGWDVFGTVIAFAQAHKEQGQKTLHWHWQIWVEDCHLKCEETYGMLT